MILAVTNPPPIGDEANWCSECDGAVEPASDDPDMCQQCLHATGRCDEPGYDCPHCPDPGDGGDLDAEEDDGPPAYRPRWWRRWLPVGRG